MPSRSLLVLLLLLFLSSTFLHTFYLFFTLSFADREELSFFPFLLYLFLPGAASFDDVTPIRYP